MALFACVAGCAPNELGEASDESVALEGAVQKGPFVLGSTIDVAMLDASGNPTGQRWYTQSKLRSTDSFLSIIKV